MVGIEVFSSPVGWEEGFDSMEDHPVTRHFYIFIRLAVVKICINC